LLCAALGTIVAASAAPYGSTVSIRSSGAVLMRLHGTPSVAEVFAFVAGALTGFSVLALLAHGTLTRTESLDEASARVLAGALHWLAIGAAVGAGVAVGAGARARPVPRLAGMAAGLVRRHDDLSPRRQCPADARQRTANQAMTESGARPKRLDCGHERQSVSGSCWACGRRRALSARTGRPQSNHDRRDRPFRRKPMPTAVPVVMRAGHGATIEGPTGGPLTFKVRGEQTNGALTAFENVIAPGDGPPLHVHAHEHEAWYVLEGELRFRLDAEIQSATAGSFVFVPRGTAHCSQNTGAQPARILVLLTPAGMERFFDRFASLPAFDTSAFRTLGREVGMEVVGAPLSQPGDPERG
jgi:quercetin dioxygenase-like cupin family protein